MTTDRNSEGAADARRYRHLRDTYTVSLLSGKVELRMPFGIVADNKAGIDVAIDEALSRQLRGTPNE